MLMWTVLATSQIKAFTCETLPSWSLLKLVSLIAYANVDSADKHADQGFDIRINCHLGHF